LDRHKSELLKQKEDHQNNKKSIKPLIKLYLYEEGRISCKRIPAEKFIAYKCRTLTSI